MKGGAQISELKGRTNKKDKSNFRKTNKKTRNIEIFTELEKI